MRLACQSFSASSWEAALWGFVVFRIFDVFKPWPIQWFEHRLPGGLGIMFDDVVAAIPERPEDEVDAELAEASRVEVEERMGETTTYHLHYAADIQEGDLPLLADSPAARAFQRGREGAVFEDFDLYAPAEGQAAAFIAARSPTSTSASIR